MLFMLISKTCNLSKAAGKAVAKKEVVITYCFVVKIYHQYSTKKLALYFLPNYYLLESKDKHS